jgi:hypothetical protein
VHSLTVRTGKADRRENMMLFARAALEALAREIEA